MMIDQLLQAIMQQLQTPKADLEKNLRAVLAEMVERMELVSHAELQRQQVQLQQAQQDMKALLSHIDQLSQQVAMLGQPESTSTVDISTVNTNDNDINDTDITNFTSQP